MAVALQYPPARQLNDHLEGIAVWSRLWETCLRPVRQLGKKVLAALVLTGQTRLLSLRLTLHAYMHEA